MIASSDTAIVSRPNGNLSNGSNGKTPMFSTFHIAKMITCVTRNVMLPENFATHSATRITPLPRDTSPSLTLRDAALRTIAAFVRSRLPVAIRRRIAAAGLTRNSSSRSPRSTISASPDAVTVAVAVREPRSSSEISPKNSPGSIVSRNTFSPVFVLTVSSTAPDLTMTIQSPGSPYSNSTLPATSSMRRRARRAPPARARIEEREQRHLGEHVGGRGHRGVSAP